MKKFVLTISVIVNVLFWSNPLFALSGSAASGIILDAETGEVLYSRNAYVPRPPASTTKIITILLALECGNLNDIVTVSKNAASVGEASLDLCAQDRLRLQELAYGTLIRSGNDGCVAIAEHISYSEEEFIGLMNLKARILGAQNTTFCNTNGLPHKCHLSTAYDLALIARYAMKNPVFRDIVSTKYYTMNWISPRKSLLLTNTNMLLWMMPHATGIKTGTTDSAGKCLVASAKSNNKEVIAVVLNSPNRFTDVRRMLEYGLRVKESKKHAK